MRFRGRTERKDERNSMKYVGCPGCRSVWPRVCNVDGETGDDSRSGATVGA